MQKYNYHCHTTFSDGENSPREMIEKAIKLGLEEIGISDHVTYNRYYYERMLYTEDCEQYISDIRKLAEEYKDKIIVRVGAELDFVENPVCYHWAKAIKDNLGFDYLIGSVHYCETGNNYLGHINIENYSTGEQKQLVDTYWRNMKACVSSGLFDIIGHLDLINRVIPKDKFDFSKQQKEVIDIIKEEDTVMEINTSGYRYDNKEQFPSVELLEYAKEKDVNIVLSSDAHVAKRLNQDFDKAEELLSDMNYKNRFRL